MTGKKKIVETEVFDYFCDVCGQGGFTFLPPFGCEPQGRGQGWVARGAHFQAK